MAEYDDIKGSDLPDISDLIKDTEETGSLDEFLARRAKKEDPAWMSVKPAVVPGSSSSNVADATSSTSPSSASSVEDARKLAIARPDYLSSGFAAQPQDKTITAPIIPIVDDVGSKTAEVIHEPTTEFAIRSHPITGTYVAEQQVISDDAWYSEVFINSKNLAVSEMTPEQIIDMMHNNEESIRRTKAANQGLREGLEVHLGKMNISQRATLLERDKKFKVRKAAEKVEGDAKPKRASTTSSSKPSNPLEKSIAVFKNSMGMTKAEIIAEVTSRGKMTDDVMKYLDKLFSI